MLPDRINGSRVPVPPETAECKRAVADGVDKIVDDLWRAGVNVNRASGNEPVRSAAAIVPPVRPPRQWPLYALQMVVFVFVAITATNFAHTRGETFVHEPAVFGFTAALIATITVRLLVTYARWFRSFFD